MANSHIDIELRGRFKLAIFLTAFIFFAEFIGGFLFNSLALLSDSAHVFMDVSSLGLSWLALYICAMPATETRTYGWHRSEVFAAFINGVTLLFVSLVIFYEAYQRLVSPPEVRAIGTMVVAFIGLAVNIIVASWLKGHKHEDLNIRSAYLHVVWDAVASVGVILSGIIIYWTNWFAADPLISIGIGIIIIPGAVKIIKESAHILLEGVPREVNIKSIVEDIKAIDGVQGIHTLHIWSICSNIHAMSAHIDMEEKASNRRGEILELINQKLAKDHHIFYTTLQAECNGCMTSQLFRTIEHKEHGH
ncbi:MAG: cation diffusion facilitator family transporter [Deltaproteobacteria bacterium]|nr:cation diffusion facilitator family transporter [Deltaproteobacteria bacterium]